jgi:hypothetical protein
MPGSQKPVAKKHGTEQRGPKGERIIPPGLRVALEQEAKRLGFKGEFRPEKFKIGS